MKIMSAIAFLLIVVCSSANAITISLSSSQSLINVGDSVTVDIFAELDDQESNLALFDFFVEFDSGIFNLSPLDYSNFGSALGGPFDSIQDIGALGSNNIFESTFLDITTLSSLQFGQSFRLFSFELTSLAPTVSSKIFLSESLFGGFLDFDGNLLLSQITGTTIVVRDATSVNTPATLSLMFLWVLVLCLRQNRY